VDDIADRTEEFFDNYRRNFFLCDLFSEYEGDAKRIVAAGKAVASLG
jgi:hypothetical protein